MTSLCLAISSGAYYDSLVLMQLQQALLQLPGVVEAGAVMGTQGNLDVLLRSGLVARRLSGVQPDDLVIAVKAGSDEEGESALAQVDELLTMQKGTDEAEYVPRSLDTAARLVPGAGWVQISVPGRYASGVARRAIGLGKNVFLFSDHVPLSEESDLKRAGEARGLLVLGPECGTAIIGGVGFGFANRLRRGSVGLVSASGTGLQRVCCSLSRHCGVSHALGTGGRDLTDEVGGVATLQGLDLLRRDPQTRVIVLISKPPSEAVTGRVLDEARRAGKPVVVHFLGSAFPARGAGNLVFAVTLEDAALKAVELAAAGGGAGNVSSVRGGRDSGVMYAHGQRYLRGLYSGGTLALEAQFLLRSHGLSVGSGADMQVHAQGLFGVGASPVGHRILDLGAEAYTEGRPHPMIDQGLRARMILEEA